MPFKESVERVQRDASFIHGTITNQNRTSIVSSQKEESNRLAAQYTDGPDTQLLAALFSVNNDRQTTRMTDAEVMTRVAERAGIDEAEAQARLPKLMATDPFAGDCGSQ